MPVTKDQEKDIINLCKHLKDRTKTAYRVSSDPEFAQTKYTEATENFKKSNAAYILAMHEYVSLSSIRHPRLRHRDSVQEALNTLLVKAKLHTKVNEPMLAVNAQETLKTFLAEAAEASDSAVITKVKDNADEYPGKQLSNLLSEFTDYTPSSKRKHAHKKHSHAKKHPHPDTKPSTHQHDESTSKVHHPKLPRKTSEPENSLEAHSLSHTPSLRERMSDRIKQKLSQAEDAVLKKRSSDGFGIFKRPSFEDITLSSSTLQSSPAPSPKKPTKMTKHDDGSGSEAPRSPGFWRRKAHITTNSRSQSKTSLPRMKKK